MFNISGMELVVIVIVALVLLGPEKIPEVARTLGRLQREASRAMRMVYSEIERAERDSWRPPPGGGPAADRIRPPQQQRPPQPTEQQDQPPPQSSDLAG